MMKNNVLLLYPNPIIQRDFFFDSIIQRDWKTIITNFCHMYIFLFKFAFKNKVVF
jgi:hypothetical protein